MMKHKLLASAVLLASTQAAFASDFQDSNLDKMGLEVTSAASVSTDYLLRGQTVSDGAPAVMGGLKVEHKSGVYVTGEVISAGDVEQNYEIGYARDLGEVALDLSYKGYTTPSVGSDADREEVSVKLNRDIFDLSVVHVLDQDFADGDMYGDDNLYVAGSVTLGSLRGTIGAQTQDDQGYQHIQLDYQATENLTFTATKAFQNESTSQADEGLRFVATYSIPLM